MALISVGFMSILSTSRRVVKSALPMPTALPSLSSVRSRATIQRIFGSAGNGSGGLDGLPTTVVYKPAPELIFPTPPPIPTSIGDNRSGIHLPHPPLFHPRPPHP